VSLVPNQQAEDELHILEQMEQDDPKSFSRRRGLATLQLGSPAAQRAQRVKELLETSRPVRISLFLLTILATAMVISDACLTPAISVLSAVGGLKEKAPHLTTGTTYCHLNFSLPCSTTYRTYVLFNMCEHITTDNMT
jgi:KUP system potassium uptake protein